MALNLLTFVGMTTADSSSATCSDQRAMPIMYKMDHSARLFHSATAGDEAEVGSSELAKNWSVKSVPRQRNSSQRP